MDYSRLKYIKNVDNINHPEKWAYKYQEDSDEQDENKLLIGHEFQLNFSRRARGVENHVRDLPKGSVIILSQSPRGQSRFLTHVVELVTMCYEDQPQWTPDQWGVFRSARVLWVTPHFDNPNRIPVDIDFMRANWGYQGSLAKSLDSKNLKSAWQNDINNLIRDLEKKRIFGLPN
ncbi:hypothetical protein [Dolichospermum sp. UHCC 0259]|uniref:hypothetical protein n=1 Tax=Dolichospermum sp. UHCC 0259 TaxID=2590010 RepID=UPI0014464DBB|nr:hypothetical protein [Dolichospermum sp. UHCC 0259]MTJ50516.1 hypothetical protein [Dolichospermum sp. UHCC 0259]